MRLGTLGQQVEETPGLATVSAAGNDLWRRGAALELAVEEAAR